MVALRFTLEIARGVVVTSIAIIPMIKVPGEDSLCLIDIHYYHVLFSLLENVFFCLK